MNKALFLLPLVLLSLLAAIWTGWLRIGWELPFHPAAAQHGALMVGSFLATLIFLERAVTFQTKWVLFLPFVNGISLLFFGVQQPAWALVCLLAGSAGFFIMCGYFVCRYRELYYYVFLAGAFCLLGGNILLYRSVLYASAVNWWMAFLLFTIVAERLELSRFLGLAPWKRNALLPALGAVLLSLFLPPDGYGKCVFTAGLAGVALWLLAYDMARRSVRAGGQHRYSALLLITGYVWLLITALLLLTGSRIAFYYDAALHSFFIGFVFSMIFSHAPIILPAVLRLPVKLYRPFLYTWFLLLQASLVLRILGDVAGIVPLRRWGGLLNGVVILLFFLSVVMIVRSELRKKNEAVQKRNPMTLL